MRRKIFEALNIGLLTLALAAPARGLGLAPVYRSYNDPASDHFYTQNRDEWFQACTIGWKQEGIGFYLFDEPVRIGGVESVALRRLWKEGTDHSYTTSVVSQDKAIINDGYVPEGIVGYVLSQEMPGFVPLYILYYEKGEDTFLTTNREEATNARKNLGYSYVGILGWVSVSDKLPEQYKLEDSVQNK